jgi:hypothetical protein
MMTKPFVAGVVFLAAVLVTAAPVRSQSIADQVDAVRDGQVRMSFTAKPGVCGDGRNINMRSHRSTDDWESWCEPGPVRVALDVSGGEIVDLDTYVGGRWRDRANVTDLGMVPAPEAAAYFLDLAATAPSHVSKHAIMPAVAADSAEAWPGLLRIAKADDRPRETRKAAVFWLSQAAGEAAAAGLEEIVLDEDEDFSVRKSAVFAVSQLPDDEGVPILVRVARTHHDPRILKQAIFWLGQSGDPRAIALFEELLTP